jgi:hypothetical protein
MKDMKLKDIGGLNGNTVKALEAGGVATMADYMGLNNNQLLAIKGVGVASVTALARSLQPQIQEFRAEASLDVPGHPDETILDKPDIIADVGMTEEVMVLPEPTAIDVDAIPDPDYGEPANLVPRPPEQPQRTESQEAKEIFVQDQDFSKVEHVQPSEPTREDDDEVFLIDVNPGLFRNHEEAVSFICDWMIASQPYIRVPRTEHNLQRAFVMRWKEHIKRMD